MLETFTMLQCCIPAFLKANSKDCKDSLCLPTPLVRKKRLGIILKTNRVNNVYYLFAEECPEKIRLRRQSRFPRQCGVCGKKRVCLLDRTRYRFMEHGSSMNTTTVRNVCDQCSRKMAFWAEY